MAKDGFEFSGKVNAQRGVSRQKSIKFYKHPPSNDHESARIW
jgi:hypothetical protein